MSQTNSVSPWNDRINESFAQNTSIPTIDANYMNQSPRGKSTEMARRKKKLRKSIEKES